jgi:Pyruvate/2-oxoacid:ferredoxin oxidoreductase delta subunit
MEADVYVRLATKVNFPKSRFIRQVFSKLVTPEEGEMILALPATPAELAGQFNISESEAAAKIDEFVRKGVVMPLEKNGVLKHFPVNNVIQVHDATIHATLNRRYEPVQDEIVPLWRKFRETEWLEIVRERDNYPETGGNVVPLVGSVKDTSQLLPHENLRTIVEQAPIIGVNDCPCRWLDVQEGNCNKPTFVCLSLTPNAVKYMVDRGIGRQLTVEEAYQVLDLAAEAGLVPMPGGGTSPRNICFCCTDCCIIFRPAVKYGYVGPNRSRFRARVDPALCDGCQDCLDRCQFNAIQMVKVPGSKRLKAVVDTEICYGCGACVLKCEPEALSLGVLVAS